MLDLDGKLYDAYVAYPSKCDDGYSDDVETFAIQTLPQVLEKACGYKLFIAGRDCQPGQGETTTHWDKSAYSKNSFVQFTFCQYLRVSVQL